MRYGKSLFEICLLNIKGRQKYRRFQESWSKIKYIKHIINTYCIWQTAINVSHFVTTFGSFIETLMPTDGSNKSK